MIYSFHNGGILTNFIPANNPDIQYFGRWDFSDSLHPEQSWPGVYIVANFSGTSIGIRIDDNVNYYNVYIDNKFYKVFHGDKAEESDYLLADSLENTNHSFRLSKRNISFSNVFTFSGILLDEHGGILPPPPEPSRKIEFIGDSYTAAEGNEATELEMKWEDKFPYTNIDKGFVGDIARHYNAQYHATCRSGIGMVCDWQGKTEFSMPKYFDRTLMEREYPKWDFKQWAPNLVVICLGLNDLSGLKGKDSVVSDENSSLFRKTYHEFISTVRNVYPGVTIVAVAAHPEWVQKNVKQVVDEEIAAGHKDISYAQFGFYPGQYVANGHPTVEIHKKIAEEIIKAIDKTGVFSETK
jgi:lysophospholipase L1-like esterase